MNCDSCKSERICRIGAKCSDCFGAYIGDNDHEGYVPKDLGIGGGDYIQFSYCMDCGKIQGNFPLQHSKLEITNEEDEEH